MRVYLGNMIAPKKHLKEEKRLETLKSFSILDTLPELDYDNITTIASEICGTPIALVSLVDDQRQWFKSKVGIDVPETSRDVSFCGHAINSTENIFIVQDARTDERFHDNPIVKGDTKVIFYAGVPLIAENGLPLGTLCVIDHKPHLLSQSQISSLQALSNQVMNLLKLRKNEKYLQQALITLEEKNLELERFAFIAAHDLKSPLNNISSLTTMFLDLYGLQVDKEGQEILQMILDSSEKLKTLIEGLLDYSRSDTILKEKKSKINLKTLKTNIENLFSFDHNIEMVLQSELVTITINETAMDQILINLVTNAIKYNDKDSIRIEIGASESDTHYNFYVQDNGPGIPKDKQEQIFKIFKINANHDRFGKTGNGIGLATVKKIIEKSAGSIHVESEIGMGAKFIFTLKK